ncbi:MAG TPA: tyrosine-type recombinase/integrase [Micromonosporaceae bacterium]|nr:tyrosine-type recombinase/integrase [Micromonosporaceae bacterium]
MTNSGRVAIDGQIMKTYLDAHLTHLRAAGRSARTIHDRAGVLRRADTQLPHGLFRAAAAELEAWLATPSWSRWTLCTYQMHLRGFYHWLTSGHDPMADYNPMTEIERPRTPACIPDPVTDEELARALARSDPIWRLVITLTAYAGLRASEAGRLRREEVTAESLIVRGGKGGLDAVLPTHPAIWVIVKDLPPGPLFAPAFGARLSSRARAHFDQLGMPEVHLHRFRHWYGTTVQRAQGDLRVTQELMRHASPATTAGYAKVTDEQRRQAVTALPILATPTSRQDPA